jgi:hypothetical protein
VGVSVFAIVGCRVRCAPEKKLEMGRWFGEEVPTCGVG